MHLSIYVKTQKDLILNKKKLMKTIYKIIIGTDAYLSKDRWDTYLFISLNKAKAFLKQELKKEWVKTKDIKEIIKEINETWESQRWQDFLPVNFDFSILWEIL